jgi:hypothetical protein
VVVGVTNVHQVGIVNIAYRLKNSNKFKNILNTSYSIGI